MGASSSSGADKYGEWRNDYECNHPIYKKVVLWVKWKSVPITNSAGLAGITIARGLTLGLSEIAFKGQDYSHDVVEANVECMICHRRTMYTLQYSKDGRTFYPGYFGRYYSDEGVARYNPNNMTLQHLCRAFENVWPNIDSSDYDAGDMNCKHYAKDLYNYIYRNY
jgi:hypothetical protein